MSPVSAVPPVDSPIFSAAVVTAVLGHMNDDHGGDNLLIAQAFGSSGALESTMTDLDEHGGTWVYSGEARGGHSVALTIPWSETVHERSDIRSQIVRIYELACARTGIVPRSASAPLSFSESLRARTRAGHQHSAGHGFISTLISDAGTLESYTALVVQHFFLYEALDAAAARVIGDPQARGFITDRLARVPALEADLVFLLGPEWRETASALPATRRYMDRIAEVAADRWVGGVIAHHYTRYLGDLSGGQIIRGMLRARFGFVDDGVRFYAFDRISNPAEFVGAYRARLDALDWLPDYRERVITEVLAAYEYNTDVFEELAAGAHGPA